MSQSSSKKPLSDIKSINQRHYSGLTSKNSLDNCLIDDIRSFCKQRSVIEKDYAQALQKLSNAFITKKEIATMTKQSQENLCMQDSRNLWYIWRNILQETQLNSAARQRLSECHLRLSTELKPLKSQRLATSKQIFDQLKSLQGDLAASVQEMCKSHKVYHEEEKQSHDIRSKSYVAEEKLRRKSTNLFNSMATLHRNHEKLASYKEACETRSTSARNEYLFQLAAINAHLKHYYNKDIPDLSRILDGDLYERIREVFSTICKNEAEMAAIHHKKFDKLSLCSSEISRNHEWQAFAKELQVEDCDVLQYAFQPCEKDQIKSLCPPHAKDEETLDQIGRKLARRLVIRQRRIKAYIDEMRSLQSDNHSNGQHSETKSNSLEYEENEHSMGFNLEYVENKLEELQFAIRREEIEKCKVDACLQLMRQSPVNVEALIKEAEQAAETAEKAALAERERLRQKEAYDKQHGISPLEDSPSPQAADEHVITKREQKSFIISDDSRLYSYLIGSGDDSYLSGGPFTGHKINQTHPSESNDLINFDSYLGLEQNTSFAPSFLGESGGSSNGDDYTSTKVDCGSSAGSSSCKSPEGSKSSDMESVWSEQGRLRKATVIREYRARNRTESDLVKFENVVLLEKPPPMETTDMAWVKVRSLIDGKEGQVPLRCLELHKSPAPLPPVTSSSASSQEQQTRKTQGAHSPSPPREPAPKLSPNFVENLIPGDEIKSLMEGDFVRTLVDYTGSDPDELTFVSGSVIRVTSNCRGANISSCSADSRKSAASNGTSGIFSASVDDGWWEGDLILTLDRPGLYSVRRGVFASMLVEPLPDSLVERWQDLWEQSQLAIGESLLPYT
ncbi:F-BAR and double SH3 domains protein 1 [Cichlidogyrus casuarinus]|uniref:F-BAR and double SH3 domains protein 1 n=1 Tax=Cichlidogyrus casuarinus TaxID=1844966 RepID=A0ABD2QK34_9PLAT